MDADGKDPIYTKRFFGQIKLIGDDGKCGSGSYLVKGAIARKVRKASKSNQFYEGDLSENDSVVHIPTGQSLEVVKQSYEDTEASQKENGGHSYAGEDNAVRWDEDTSAETYIDNDGRTVVKATLRMFVVNGVNTMPNDASNIQMWWHTHPNTTIDGISLGSSNPSEKDYRGQQVMRDRGYKGNTFVIGVRTRKVTFYSNKRNLITVSWKSFVKMGNQK